MTTQEGLRVSGLWRYPVKSLRGLACERLEIGPRGPLGDREWMLVDDGGRFLSQRQCPRMALVAAEPQADGLLLRAPGMDVLTVARPSGGGRIPVRIWNDDCEGEPAAPEADAWLSDFLGLSCRLVRFPEGQRRQVDTRYARPGDQVGFADGFPLLLITQASLDGLNARLRRPVDMRRFRPNLVVSGAAAPHAEDDWHRLRIGDLEFEVVKPCSRCPIPGIDPDTGEKAQEPLLALATYRRGEDNRIYFGQNLIHRGQGELRLGQVVEVLA
jgi:uncharacterized protein YcbX